jgi:hypothetical protein
MLGPVWDADLNKVRSQVSYSVIGEIKLILPPCLYYQNLSVWIEGLLL